MRITKTYDILIHGTPAEFLDLFMYLPRDYQEKWKTRFHSTIFSRLEVPTLKMSQGEWTELTRHGKPASLELIRDDLPPAEPRGRFTGNVLTQLPGEREEQYVHRMKMEAEIDRRIQESMDRHQKPPIIPGTGISIEGANMPPAAPVDNFWIHDKDHPVFLPQGPLYDQEELDYYQKIRRIGLDRIIPRREKNEPIDLYRARLRSIYSTLFERILEVMGKE